MEDPNLIACLFPSPGSKNYKKFACDAIRKSENRSRYIAPEREEVSSHGSRESTVSSEDDEDLNSAFYPGLQLTLNHGPKIGTKFVIGTDPNSCDIVLPNLHKISRQHCHLTFDTKQRLILRDTSSYGTSVTYDQKGGEKRKTIVTYDEKGQEIYHYFTWILSGGRFLVTVVEDPSPQLIFEYIPLGTLQDVHTRKPITNEESLTLLCQCLDALTSVHEHDIVHRDIKPENILVQSREPFHIKLSDFGVSKATGDLQTFVGTHEYTAPEIWGVRPGIYYTKSCDIWSLGVVVFKYAYRRLPTFHMYDVGPHWCRKIINTLNDGDSDDFIELLSTGMLVMELESRLPARNCWEQALRLSPQNRCITPTQASYLAGYDPGYSPGYFPKGTSTKTPDFYARGSKAELDPWNYVSQSKGLVAGPNWRASDHTDPFAPDPFAPTEVQGHFWPSIPPSGSYTSNSAQTRKRSSRTLSSPSSSSARRRSKRHSKEAFSSNSRGPRKSRVGTIAGEDDAARDNLFDRCVQAHQATGDNGFDDPAQEQHRQDEEHLAVLKAYTALRSASLSAISFSPSFTLLSEYEPKNPRNAPVSSREVQIGWDHLLPEPGTRLSSPEAPENLSTGTRSLRFDRENQVYVVIRRHAVAMRISDYKLNATEIFNAAGLNQTDRHSYLEIFKSRGIITQIKAGGEQTHSWIPFQDGLFLCQALNLGDETKELFSQGLVNSPREKENYLLKWRSAEAKLPDGYKALQWHDKLVTFVPSTRRINATQLLKLGNNPKARLEQFFSQNRHVSKHILRGGNVSARGTYIDFEDARLFCRHFSLSEGPIDTLAGHEKAPGASLRSEPERTVPAHYHEGAHDEEGEYNDEGTHDDGNLYDEDPNVKIPGYHANGSYFPS